MYAKIKLKPLIISIAISLGVGILSGILTMNSFNDYKNLNLPPLSPPSLIFPIIWSILYILMGISAYIIYTSNNENRHSALKIYSIQLIVNFIWPILFFKFKQYLLSFIWLVILIILVTIMIIKFYKINKFAGYLQIPYLIWILFAGYLNLGVYILN